MPDTQTLRPRKPARTKARGKLADGKRAAGKRASGKRVNGKRADGKPANGKSVVSSARPDARVSDVHDKLYVATSDLHGLGMFASGRLKADVVLGRLAGMPTYEDGTYVLWLTDELGLEVTNDFRFINHSKTPNCMLTDVDVVTVRPVAVDEELTHDYGWP